MANSTYGNAVFGLRDLKVTNAAGSTQEDLGAGQTLTVSPQFVGGPLEGDDSVVSYISFITHATGNLTAGQVSSAALAIMLGLSLDISGTTPTEVTELQIDAGTRMPYHKIYGQAYDDGIGDMHLLMSRAKVTGGLELKFENGSWYMSQAEMVFLDDGTNGIVRQLQHETATALPAT